MRGCVLYGTIMIGLVLLASPHLLPESVVVWFADEQTAMQAWRLAIVSGLLALIVVYAHFHNAYLKLVWGVVAVGLGWSGGIYFLDNPAYVFDALLMLGASATFGIHALLPADYPLSMAWFEGLLRLGSWLFMPAEESATLLSQPASWHYISEVETLGHRLILNDKNT